MKKLPRLFPLLIIALGMLIVTNNLFHITVNATYVEGHIAQETTWALSDSPFVVSKDLIVDPGVTLTISPGVEVRFGGDFALTVAGKLSAVGATDRMITFTSNKLQPLAGDWNSIVFNSSTPSTIAYCSVRYAINGITIKNGSVEIRNSRISDNSESGIYATGANQATIRENTIQSNKNGVTLEYSASGVNINHNSMFSNTQAGVYVHAYAYSEAKENYDAVNATAKIHDVSISDNTMTSNAMGIFVHSHAVANASYYYYVNASASATIQNLILSSNTISSNTQTGIRVYSYENEWLDSWWDRRPTQVANAHAYTDVTVLGNILSDNPKGIFVSGVAATNVTHNLISFSDIGAFYEQATDNLANYNDIYSNTHGMNVSLGAVVNAEQNYWGDASGPYHASLNPSGRGNSVNGDGVNLDFIPFSTAPYGYVSERPLLSVQVTASITTVRPLSTLNVTVHVSDGSNPVSEATVELSSTGGGNFSATMGNTDPNGDFKSVFTAPQTSTAVNLNITATARKSGDFGSNHVEIIVNPQESGSPDSLGGGLSLTTLLIILVPVIVVVVVVVLIWRKRRGMRPQMPMGSLSPTSTPNPSPR